MDYEQYDLSDLKDESLTIPPGAYTISTGRVLIVWYDKDNNRHVNGMGWPPMSDYKALIEKARGAQAATYGVDMWSHEVFGRLADAVEALDHTNFAQRKRIEELKVERDALQAQLDEAHQTVAILKEAQMNLRILLENTCAHPYSRLKFDGGSRAVVCTSCNHIVTHMEVSE